MKGINKLPKHSININIFIPSLEGIGEANKLLKHSININIFYTIT